MTTVKEIDAFMSDWAKPAYSESWDNDGVMLCESPEREIRQVLVCLEINAGVLQQAAEQKTELIVTHHPFIFHPLRRIEGSDSAYLALLFEKQMSVLSYHTRLDCAPGGVNDVLAETLGLEEIRPFGDGEMPMGRVGRLPSPLSCAAFAELLKEKLSCGTLRAGIPEGKDRISRVAVLGGAGKDALPEAAAEADAFVTADLTHNAFITAKEKGLCVFDAGHYHTENPVIHRIASRLKEAFPALSVSVGDAKSPFVLL